MAETAPIKQRKKPVRRRPKRDGPTPIDMHVGNRIRLRRTMLGLSQEKLADKIGLSFQQVQKYERGANGVSATRLWELSALFEVPVEYFFEDISSEAKLAASKIVPAQGFAEAPAMSFEADPAATRQSMDLVNAYKKIGAPSIRKRLYDLVKALAALDAAESATADGD